MKYSNRHPMAERFCLGALLTVVGGFLDAYTYLTRGRAFATAQTGNIVLLGLWFAEGNMRKVIYYFLPVLAYAIGVLVAEFVRHRFRSRPTVHWRHVVLILEFLLMAALAFIPDGEWNFIANISVSFTCAMQVESFRSLHGNPFATTMCTGNLRSGTEALFLFFRNCERKYLVLALQYYGIILFFIGGAALSSVLTGWFGVQSVLLCCALLMAAFLALMLEERDAEKVPE